MTMEEALAADGEKLQQVTGENHGPDSNPYDWGYDDGFYDGVQAALQGSTRDREATSASLDWVQDVRDFHKACGTVDPTEPTWPSYDKRSLRYHLQFEEGNELSAELLPEHCLFVGQFLSHAVESQEHLAALAKEIVDVIYVAVGTALSCGININAVWEAVHASNMAKVDPAIGKVRRRDDGKILKPEGWQTPDIKKVLFPE